MLYSPSHQFIFVHIYKTGGESVMAALRKYCPVYLRNRYVRKSVQVLPGVAQPVMDWREALVNRQHMTAEQIREVMPGDLFDAAVKFAFVRNPWDWQVSEYSYACQSTAHPYHEQVTGFGDFDTYIRHKCENDTRLQCSFVYDRTGTRLVQHIGRFETLSDDFARICAALGLDETLPHVNASKRKRDWRSYYNDTTFDLVREAYKLDIQTFGYRDGVSENVSIPDRLNAPAGWHELPKGATV